MADPAHAGRAGDGHLEDRPVEDARHDPDADVDQVPVEEAADEDVSEISEDKPGRPDRQLRCSTGTATPPCPLVTSTMSETTRNRAMDR